jgi:hypothetical protein
MIIIWFKGKTELARKRAAMNKKKELEKRGHRAELVNKKEKGETIWGVKYW